MQDETDATQGVPEGETAHTLATEQAPDPSAEQNADNEGQRVESSDGEQQAEDEGEQPKRTPWFQRRIDELTRARHEERREKEALQIRLQAYADRDGATRQDDSQGQQPERRQASEAEIREQVRREEQTRVANDRFNADCNRTYEKGSSEYSDFNQSVQNLQMLGAMRPEVLTAVFEVADKDAHKVLYQLGKDPEEASRILSLSPVRMAVELAKLSSQAPKPPVVSKAPAPIAPINGGAAQAEKDPNKMSTDQWLAWRNKQLAQRA